MKKKFIILTVGFMVLTTPVVSVQATENEIQKVQIEENASVSRADVIITKYRTYNGVLQYRRWNETRGVWVDDEWITMT
ncbi:MAG: hypothetical protein LUG83_08645 [Lachnospiraceae bacterium]|nr:hypothetical protein [Lachnospiraceae bacterium]